MDSILRLSAVGLAPTGAAVAAWFVINPWLGDSMIVEAVWNVLDGSVYS